MTTLAALALWLLAAPVSQDPPPPRPVAATLLSQASLEWGESLQAGQVTEHLQEFDSVRLVRPASREARTPLLVRLRGRDDAPSLALVWTEHGQVMASVRSGRNGWGTPHGVLETGAERLVLDTEFTQSGAGLLAWRVDADGHRTPLGVHLGLALADGEGRCEARSARWLDGEQRWLRPGTQIPEDRARQLQVAIAQAREARAAGSVGGARLRIASHQIDHTGIEHALALERGAVFSTSRRRDADTAAAWSRRMPTPWHGEELAPRLGSIGRGGLLVLGSLTSATGELRTMLAVADDGRRFSRLMDVTEPLRDPMLQRSLGRLWFVGVEASGALRVCSAADHSIDPVPPGHEAWEGDSTFVATGPDAPLQPAVRRGPVRTLARGELPAAALGAAPGDRVAVVGTLNASLLRRLREAIGARGELRVESEAGRPIAGGGVAEPVASVLYLSNALAQGGSLDRIALVDPCHSGEELTAGRAARIAASLVRGGRLVWLENVGYRSLCNTDQLASRTRRVRTTFADAGLETGRAWTLVEDAQDGPVLLIEFRRPR